jgi:16S rRNA (cytosine967-C5)-methyltransferase
MARKPQQHDQARQAVFARSSGTRREPSSAKLAELTAAVASAVVRSVLESGKRLEPAIAEALGSNRDASRQDRRLLYRVLTALLRWRGWIEPLRLVRIEDQLALAWLLDSREVNAFCRTWAAKAGHPPDRVLAVGDAPSWTARAEGLKRWMGGHPVNADPWLLFPGWLREQLPLPPGQAAPKARRLDFLFALQSRWPLWVGVRGGSEKAIWSELRDAGLKPWIHRRLTTAARLEADADLGPIRPYRKGELTIQDLCSQALGKVCDPDPGERWWDVCGGGGLHALHLGALMAGKGTVITTFEHERHRHDSALRLRRSHFHNIAARLWDGRHPPGKPGSFDGVLLDAPCSGVGHWRRHPEVRWTVRKEDLSTLAERQRQLLDVASTAVRVGGLLVYSVATVTVVETSTVIDAFLAAHPEFHLDPFPHPLEETTTVGTLQLWPHLHDGEARFMARMIRKTPP